MLDNNDRLPLNGEISSSNTTCCCRFSHQARRVPVEEAMGMCESAWHRRTIGGSWQQKRREEGEPCGGTGWLGRMKDCRWYLWRAEASRAHRAEKDHTKHCGGGASREGVCGQSSSLLSWSSCSSSSCSHTPAPALQPHPLTIRFFSLFLFFSFSLLLLSFLLLFL